MEALKLQILKQLKCPACKQYLLAPIEQCANGHSICGTCKGKLSVCPLCKVVFTETKSYVLEALIEQMKAACPDCKEKLPLRGDNHMLYCSAQIINCRLTHCEWSGKRGLIVQHFNDKHKRHIVKNSSKYETHQLAVSVVQCNEHYFWVKSFSADGQYFWTAQDIFGHEENKKFHFTIKVHNDDVEYKFSQPCLLNSQPEPNILKKTIGIQESLITGKNAEIYICIDYNTNDFNQWKYRF